MVSPCFDLLLDRAGFFIFPGVVMNKKRITIKDRRAAADLLAIKEGYTTRQKKHIDAVGALSDAEIYDLLNEDIPAAPAACEVEEIRPGGLPSDLYAWADSMIDSFCSHYNIDKYKMSGSQWSACCSYIGRWIRSRSLLQTENKNSIIKNNFNKIDAAAAESLLPVWEELTGVYKKTPLIYDFCKFCGLSYDWLYNMKRRAGVTSSDDNLYKKVQFICDYGITPTLTDPRESSVSQIYYNKAYNGRLEAPTVSKIEIIGPVTAAALPVFDDNGQIIEKKP